MFVRYSLDITNSSDIFQYAVFGATDPSIANAKISCHKLIENYYFQVQLFPAN